MPDHTAPACKIDAEHSELPRAVFWHDVIAMLVLAGLVAIQYGLLPKTGDIWWSDASRHALNGAFVLDAMRSLPIHHLVEFATDYYRKWPGLTIGFYPPLFYLEIAASYAAFGVSEAAALVPEMLSLLLLAWGTYRLAQNWMDRRFALAAAMLLAGAPGVGFWGRQVMLDIPAYAWIMWAAVLQLRYLRNGHAATLYLAVICAVAAVYTKYNAAFFPVVMAAATLAWHRQRPVASATTLKAAALGVLLLLPLTVMFAAAATYNITQAEWVGAASGRWSLGQLTYYARVMPDVLSWPVVLLTLLFCLTYRWVRREWPVRADAAYLLIWFLVGYVFYTMIVLKEPRHVLFITGPVVILAVLAIERAFAIAQRAIGWRKDWGSRLALALAALTFATTTIKDPPPDIHGVRQAAQDVARVAPQDTNVAFWGWFDGTFIYAMRAYAGRPDLGVVRLNKVLVDYTIGLGRGFVPQDLSAEQIKQELSRLHVQYVVVQEGYATQIPVIRSLYAVLRTDAFREVARIPMTSNYPASDMAGQWDDGFFPTGYLSDIVIYRAAEDVQAGRIAPVMRLGIIGRSF